MTWLKKHDVLTKALAVLIAIVLWFYVVSVSNSVSEIGFKDLLPTFVGSEELMTSRNLSVVGDYSVDVEISADRHDILRLNKSDIKVEVDVSEISSAGTYELPYTVTTPSNIYTVTKKKPAKLTVKFDEENAKAVVVKIPTDDIAADGYVVDKTNVSVSPREIKITGLQEEVEKISYAQVNVPQSNSKQPISEKMSYDFYDSDGKIVKLSSIDADYEVVDVLIPILKTREVSLVLDVEGNDNLKKYVNYSIEPATITVAGEESMIEQFQTFTAGVIKLSEIGGNTVKSFTLTPPDGIRNISGETTATAKIELEGLSKKTVTTSLIELINTYTLPTGHKITPVTTSVNVDVLGTESAIKNVTNQNVRVVADLQYTVLSRGTHPIDVSIVIDGVPEAVVVNTDKAYTIYVKVS